MMNTLLILMIVVAAIVLAGWLFVRHNLRGKPASLALAEGDALPGFEAEDESGQPVSSGELRGKPAVLLFIRGNWCPFCTRQVEDLARHYKRITELGARLIFVVPKPLDTTRRVAEIFKVEFDFWLDPQLKVARQLGLVHAGGVPGKHREQFGRDTIWPTAMVVAEDGRIRYIQQSRRIVDRPDPEDIVDELEKIA